MGTVERNARQIEQLEQKHESAGGGNKCFSVLLPGV